MTADSKSVRLFYPTVGRAIACVLILLALLVTYAQDDVLQVRARQGQGIETLDPAHYVGGPEYSVDLAIYSKLVRFAPGSSELELDAARSIEVSEDGLTIDFILKEGIQFHGGYGEMTAEDVKFSFERIADPETNSGYAGDWKSLERVEVTGRYSGRIILSEPFAPLMTSTLPWNPGSIISQAAYEELGERFATQPIGSGPYYWSEWEPGQRIVLETFEDYFGEKPDFARIVIRPIVDPLIAEFSFDQRELDATEVSLDSIERYQDNPEVAVEVLPSLHYHWVGFNHEHAPFDDTKVREAVRYAIDVEEILVGAYNNVPPRANAMLPPYILGHWEDAPAYEPNLERSRQLLTEAGYPDGFSTTIATLDNPQLILGATIVQQQLARIGIEAEVEIVQDEYTRLGKESHPGLHYMSFAGVLDPGYWFTWFTCEQIGLWNFWKWCNEEYDQVYNAAAVTIDSEARAENYVELQQIIDEDVAAVWVTNGATAYVYRQDEVTPSFIGMYPQYRHWQNETD